jgi:hypothetical protein
MTRRSEKSPFLHGGRIAGLARLIHMGPVEINTKRLDLLGDGKSFCFPGRHDRGAHHSRGPCRSRDMSKETSPGHHLNSSLRLVVTILPQISADPARQCLHFGALPSSSPAAELLHSPLSPLGERGSCARYRLLRIFCQSVRREVCYVALAQIALEGES